MKMNNMYGLIGLPGLFVFTALMLGCAQDEPRVDAEESAPQVEIISGEGSGIIAEVGITGASMFEFDSAELNDEGKAAIDEYRKTLGPELTDAYMVITVGHTDNSGDKSYNMWLSLERAQSVAEYLVANGVDEAKVRSIGLGPNDPIASNDTREGRIQNRRVDIYVVAELRALDRIEFPSVSLFQRNSAELTEQGKASLDKNIATAKEILQRATFIEIVGHTDSKGDDEDNLKLSRQRAESVRNYLVSQGVDRRKMVTTGMGETMPIASNDTKEGRAANRRVQILVLGRTKE
jgi:outer membrane protein OmpA-like peptidoglycan-associated protein